MYKKTLRPAIAMIELIFALVIIGIVMMTAPMLIRTAAKSGYVTIQQEAINEAASQVNMIMGYHWDENDANESFLDPVLKTDSTTAGLVELNTTANPNTGRRPGTPKESYRSFVRDDGARLSASTIVVNTLKNNINYFDGNITHLKDHSSGLATADNIEKTTDIKNTTTVKYISDAPVTPGVYNSSSFTFDPDFIGTGNTTPSSNIKRITATLVSDSGVDELNKTIILHAFSCNIGGYKLEEKDTP